MPESLKRMMSHLQLRHDESVVGPASAWFLPGNSAREWIDELVLCGLADMETRLFPVPRSLTDRTPVGLFVLPVAGHVWNRRPRGFGCRVVANRLHVPVDAILFPPVTDAEIIKACPTPLALFHPVYGLSGFELESALCVPDLLKAPPEQLQNWNYAQVGVAPIPELSGVMLVAPPSLENLYGGAEQEIGTEYPGDLPPAPNEPRSDTVARTQRNLRQWLAKGVAGILRHVPHVGQQRTWVNAAEDWANRQLRGVNQQLDAIRQKEIHRLLHLLKADPEIGLKYAIPLNHFAHRGIGQSSARLGPRSLDFDPKKLGGQAIDPWNLTSDAQNKLRQSYREMANREMRLGRHRRAAYIFAELLGDLLAAANALRQGRCYHEAAVIYEGHLKNPAEAAACLAEGGLLLEAIDRYVKLGRWLEVAGLYEKLGDHRAFRDTLQRVVEERLAQDDILAAAKLVDERLGEPEKALQLLQGAWPRSNQAVACMGEAFRLMARLNRHEAALDTVNRLAKEIAEITRAPLLLTVLVRAARDYPHSEIRHRAGDISRVLISNRLKSPQTAETEVSQILLQLVQLAPQDRLLTRDANRYLAARKGTGVQARRVIPPPLKGNLPVVDVRFKLPRQIQWHQLRSEWHCFYATGITGQHLTLVRGVWEGEIQSVTWKCPSSLVRNGALLFEPTGERGRSVAIGLIDGLRFDAKHFPASDVFHGQECIAATPSWLPPQGFPYAYGPESIWSGHVAAGRAVLSCYDKQGRLQTTIDVTEALLLASTRDDKSRLCLAAVGNGAAIAMGNRLVYTRGNGETTHMDLPDQVVGLYGTEPNTRHGVAIMMRQEAAIHWLGSPGLIQLARDLNEPICAFIPGGPLVLISQSTVHLIEVDSRGVQKTARFEVVGGRPIGACPTSSPGKFGILTSEGEMTVYRLPR
jgi:hypothetical protein